MNSRLVLLLSSLLPLATALPAVAHDACAMPGANGSAACAPSQSAACCDTQSMRGMKPMKPMKPMKGACCDAQSGGHDDCCAPKPRVRAMGACACGAQSACGGNCGGMGGGCMCGAHAGGNGNLLQHPDGRMGWRASHPVHISQELRYAPGTTTLTGAWTIARPMNDWFSVGLQTNYAWQVMPSLGQGHWFSDYMGILPRVGKEAGPFGLHLGALVGAGAMLRTFDAPGVGTDLLQLRAMWAIEPRVELSYRMGGHSIGLVGTYLWTPNQADLGGFSLGLQTTFAGPSWGR